ncbi:MAG: hypothetical protein J0H01_14430 [Rhizobiales bacterium]|nr:hypothetical protein [Hyphomicrobiales bacterium]
MARLALTWAGAMRVLAILATAGLVAGAVSFRLAQRKTALERLPEALGVEAILAQGTGTLLDCDSVIFRLDAAMRETLRRDGMQALAEAGRPRGVTSWQYGPWQATPVDSEARESWSVSGYVWPALGCGLPPDWREVSRAAATRPGSFYAFGRRILLLVDPARGLAIYVHRG